MGGAVQVEQTVRHREREKRDAYTHTRTHGRDGVHIRDDVTPRRRQRTTNNERMGASFPKKHTYMQYTPITAIDDDIYAYKENAAL